jgi:hypothetical protein
MPPFQPGQAPAGRTEAEQSLRPLVEAERADISIYLISLARTLHAELISAALAKIEKGRRRYPVERVAGLPGHEIRNAAAGRSK